MVNIDFLVISYFVSLFVDWVFQWGWQATNKSKWGKKDNKVLSLLAVTSHSLIYGSMTSVWTLSLLGDIQHSLMLVFLVLTISHLIIDTRIPVKLIMKFKGMSNDQINDYINFGFMHIGIDHRLHELVLLILSMFV